MSNLFGGGAKTASTTPTQALGIQFNSSQYGPPVPVIYGTGKTGGSCLWYGDFKSHASSQKVGKGGGSTTTGYTYSASFMLGLCEGPIQGIGTVFSGTSTVSLSSVGAVIANGNIGQASWSHLSGAFALGYSQTAWIAVANLNLGSSASLPNWSPEVHGLLIHAGSQDANPADVLNDICTNANHGINFPWLGDLTQYSNYCVATGLLLSPCYDQEQTAQQTLDDLLKYTNAAAWFSEGVLKIQPYGDVAVTGNGVTYNPNLTPLFNLGEADYIVTPGQDPVTVTRKSPADCMNIVRVEFQDRSNSYHSNVVVGSIDQDVVQHGGRSDNTESVDMCKTAAVARFIAQNLVQNAYYIRNTYEFKLSWRYCMLEPMDIVTLTDANTGLNQAPVRIIEVSEDESGVLSITAEEFPEGIGHSAIYNTQPNNGGTIDPNSDPGAVNPPYLFRGPGFLVSNNAPEIWCAVNGPNALWGGAEVWLSHDGSSYNFMGTIAQPARYGALATALPSSASDPDTTNTPQVTLYQNAQLLGGSQADADNLNTLSMVDTEIHSYETATLVSGETYQLGYLRRAAYGSAVATHSIGAPWVRLDDAIFRIPVDPSQIGTTVYVKFLSLNIFGRTPRTLAGETAYTYVVGTNVELPDVPPIPASFGTQGVADGVSITWSNSNPAAVGCTSIERSTSSSGPFSVIAQLGPTTTGYTDHFTNGATYYYRARARGPLVSSGWSGYTAVFNSSGVNVGAISNTANTALGLATASPVINPQFSNGMTGWGSNAGAWYEESAGSSHQPDPIVATYVVHPGSTSTPIAGASNDLLRNVGHMPVSAGQTVSVAVCALALSVNAGALGYGRISWRDASNAEIGTSVPNGSTTYPTCGAVGTGTYTHCVTKVVASAPAGAVYAVGELAVSGHTSGYFTFSNLCMGILPASVDEVPDGSTYARTNANALQSGVPIVVPGGKNFLFNGSFASNNVGTVLGASLAAGAAVCDGWTVTSKDAAWLVAYEHNAGSNADILMRLQGGTVIANGASFNAFVQTVAKYPVVAGQPYLCTVSRGSANNVALPSGVTVTARFYVSFQYADGTAAGTSSTVDQVGTAAATASGTVNGTVPANAVTAMVTMQAIVTNASGSSQTLGTTGQLPADLRFYNASLVLANNLDTEVVNGTTYARTLGNALQNGVPQQFAGGKNVLANGTFSNNLSGTPSGTSLAVNAAVTDGWQVSALSGAHIIEYEASSSGSDILMRLVAGATLTAGGTASSAVATYKNFSAQGSAPFSFSVVANAANNIALNSGITVQLVAFINWYNGVGGLAGQSVLTQNGNSYSTLTLNTTGTTPTNAVSGSMSFQINVTNSNGSVTAVSGATGAPADIRILEAALVMSTQLATEVSGTLATQKNLPAVTFSNFGSGWNGLTLSYSATTTSATISATAATLQAGSDAISYNASSVTVSGTAGTSFLYYLYYNDPSHAGGSLTLVATTSQITALSNNGNVLLGTANVTYPTSGTGTGSGGGYCPLRKAWVIKRGKDGRRQFIRAGQVRVGDFLLLCSGAWGEVTYSKAELADCVRLISKRGTLGCSASAPIKTRQGVMVAPECAGKDAMVLTEGVAHARVERVLPIGQEWTQHITCQNDFFWAGDSKNCLFAHHNMKPP